MIPPEAVNAVQGTVNLLVDGEYVALQNLTQGKNYAAADLAELVRALGHELVHPDPEAFHDPDVAAVETVVDGKRSIRVDFPLWTEEGSRDDLLLRLTLTEVMERVFGVRIDSIGS